MFIIKEDIVGKFVSVYDDSNGLHDLDHQLVYRGRVRAIALHHLQQYVLLIEVTEVVRPSYNNATVGSLVISIIPNEWEIVKLDTTVSDEARTKETPQ